VGGLTGIDATKDVAVFIRNNGGAGRHPTACQVIFFPVFFTKDKGFCRYFIAFACFCGLNRIFGIKSHFNKFISKPAKYREISGLAADNWEFMVGL